ncbi:MAG: 2-oxoacid ferredoxin oxidoreductase, partial [Phyllobacteriaceae bacterium]|nr:2-oxoacid ferredoxin oxidoreductase [Phyllobacteriaceae bacterium]
MATNLFMVGVAFQAGTIPLKAESLEQAIRGAGVGVEQGVAAFRWGRLAVVDRAAVEAEIAKYAPKIEPAKPSKAVTAIVDGVGATGETRRLVEVRVGELVAYQNAAYAKRYAEVVRRVVAAEEKVAPGKGALAQTVARHLHKLMAYKDEYEVARLHADPAFLADLDAQFPDGYEVVHHLAPPMLAKPDPETGLVAKTAFGPWIRPAFKALAKLKGLRGTPLDPFGKTEERQTERRLIEDYVHLVDEILAKLTPANHAAAVALADVVDEIRGYGRVKEKAIAAAKTLEAERRVAFRAASAATVAAAAE